MIKIMMICMKMIRSKDKEKGGSTSNHNRISFFF
jgi:hypothetical protein